MVKLDKIYTRGGDGGLTSLGDGTRLKKYDLRVAAYGSTDEANAVIGVALLHVDDTALRACLLRVQNDLFDLGADLCRPEGTHNKVEPLRVVEAQVTWLEGEIDRFNEPLAPLRSFVLSGGSAAAAHLHHARTVVRRAERLAAELADHTTVNPVVLTYLNRLSDLLFVLARCSNDQGATDVLWVPGQNR